MEDLLQELKARLREVSDLQHAAALLHWDQATFMPPGGAEARGRQIALLSKIAHEQFTHPRVGELLDALQPYAAELGPDADDAALLRVTRREYTRSVRVPAEFVAELGAHQAATYETWTKARPANDFAMVLPYLGKTLALSQEYAGFFPNRAHIADPLIDIDDPGVTVVELRPLFAALREQLVPLVEAISARPSIDDACLHAAYSEDRQLAVGRDIITRIGFDFTRGRQDKSPHPFMTQFSLNDVRLTTRVKENDISESLFSIIHEAGHGLYGQNIAQKYEGTPLADGASSGVHESSSRLWENLVGRSRDFWTFYYPLLQQEFPGQLGAVPMETFYRAINKVQRSLIRTDADELTYNLHVIIRFDLEMAMLEGTLAVSDLPEAWNARYQHDLGLTPPDDRHGVLQDVHWFGGLIGGQFQCYTLGNILNAQFFAAAVRACPDIPAEIRAGKLDTLRGWLTAQIYRHGRKYTMSELIQHVTGGPLSITPYIAYLQGKFGEIYGV